jgi:cyclic pyranopterin phosphate synthase
MMKRAGGYLLQNLVPSLSSLSSSTMLHGSRVALGRSPWIEAIKQLQSRSFSHSKDEDSVEDFNKELESIFGAPLASPSQLGTKNPRPNSDIQQRIQSVFDAKPDMVNKVIHDDENIVAPEMHLSHVDMSGKAAMVNISEKTDTKRMAVATGRVLLGPHAFALVAANSMSKGDVLTVAKIAGISGAKQTSNLVPFCHNLLLSGVDVSLRLHEATHSVGIEAKVTTIGPTGVEMEALTAVSVASLTVYDMCKAVSKDIRICDIQLESKTGGKSGPWSRDQS